MGAYLVPLALGLRAAGLVAAALERAGDVAAPLVRGEALPLPPAAPETQGVTVTDLLAAAEPLAAAVALPLRAEGLTLAAEVVAELCADGLALAAAVALPLRAEALTEGLAACVADALAAPLGAHVTPAVVVLVDSLSLPQATANVSTPTATAMGMRTRASWRFISASFLFDCYLNIPNEHETCSDTAVNYKFITTAAGRRRTSG